MERDKTTESFVRYRIYYRSYFRPGSSIITDFNRKGSIHLRPEIRRVPNFYGLHFAFPVLNVQEIAAEKIRALITRNQPRDYFDAYFILKTYGVDLPLLRKKLEEAGEGFDTGRIYRNAGKVYSRWETGIGKFTSRTLTFLECIRLIRKFLPEE